MARVAVIARARPSRIDPVHEAVTGQCLLLAVEAGNNRAAAASSFVAVLFSWLAQQWAFSTSSQNRATGLFAGLDRLARPVPVIIHRASGTKASSIDESFVTNRRCVPPPNRFCQNAMGWFTLFNKPPLLCGRNPDCCVTDRENKKKSAFAFPLRSVHCQLFVGNSRTSLSQQ